MHDKFAQLNNFQTCHRNGWIEPWAGKALLQIWSFTAKEAGVKPCHFWTQNFLFWQERDFGQGPHGHQDSSNPIIAPALSQPGLGVHMPMSIPCDRMQADAAKPTQKWWDEMSSGWQDGLVLFSVCWTQVVKSLQQPLQSFPLLLSAFCLF